MVGKKYVPCCAIFLAYNLFRYVQLTTRYMLAEMYAGLHVKCWFFLYDFDQNYIGTKVFPNLWFLNTKFYTYIFKDLRVII